ncbi:helix-turn-helix domain-containing protein [Pedobacter sp. Leaf132]|uniref:DUF7768 domain-containing protein n=1 Tax=Pedobacter sp. Leaf132 TaxID=2876557 RepID=UPI001E365539|nr:helix-turn-helix domain-containing protein [Pedobacter sp. Leaf132]
MKVAYIAHPIGGNVNFNIREVIKHVGDINRSEPDIVPFAPYIVDCMALNDDKPEERERGFKNNYHYFESGFVQELRLYGTHVSAGMLEEIAWAGKFGIEVKSFINNPNYENDLFGDIVKAVAQSTGLHEMDILSKARKREFVDARKMVIGLHFEMNGRTKLTSLAQKLGIDHSTVIYNHKTCEGLLFSNPKFKAIYNSAKSLL